MGFEIAGDGGRAELESIACAQLMIFAKREPLRDAVVRLLESQSTPWKVPRAAGTIPRFAPALVKVEPLARLLKVPVIADDEVLLMTVKTVPAMSVPVLRSAKTNCAALLFITPLAATCVALRVVRSKAHF